MQRLSHIFRSVIIIKYSSNPDEHTYDTVAEYAEQNNLDFGNYDVKELLSKLEYILKTLVQKDPTDEEAEEILRNQIREVSEQNVREVLKLWNTEKSGVYEHLQKKYSKCYSLKDTKWSTNQKVYGKNAKNIKETTAIFGLDLFDPDNIKEQKSCVFELTPDELNKFCSELEDIESKIDTLIAPEQ